jgi:hypothetical protein
MHEQNENEHKKITEFKWLGNEMGSKDNEWQLSGQPHHISLPCCHPFAPLFQRNADNLTTNSL